MFFFMNMMFVGHFL